MVDVDNNVHRYIAGVHNCISIISAILTTSQIGASGFHLRL